MGEPTRCDSCNSNVTGERVVCFGCHEQVVADASAPSAPFVPCPDYAEGQSHLECPRCGGFGAVTVPALAAAVEEARKALKRNEHAYQTPFNTDGCKCMGCALARLLAVLAAFDRAAGEGGK